MGVCVSQNQDKLLANNTTVKEINFLLDKAKEYKNHQMIQEAKQIYYQVLNLQKQVYGQISQQVSCTLNKIGALSLKSEQFEEAKQNFTQQLELNKQCFGEQHLKIGVNYLNLSKVYLATFQFDEAFEYINKSLDVYQKNPENEQMKICMTSQAIRQKRKIEKELNRYKEIVLDLELDEKQNEEMQEDVCSICLEEIKLKQIIGRLKCGHIFHKHCITKWLHTLKKCPYCRG